MPSAKARQQRRAALRRESLALLKEREKPPCPLLRARFAGEKVSRAGTAAPREVWHVAIGPDSRNASSSSSECRAGRSSRSHPSGTPPSLAPQAGERGKVGLAPRSARGEITKRCLGGKSCLGKSKCSRTSPAPKRVCCRRCAEVGLESPRSCQTSLGLLQALYVGSQLGKPTATSEAMKAIVAACLDAVACADTFSV